LKIVRAYLLKELFKDLWTYKRKAWAKKFGTPRVSMGSSSRLPTQMTW
jgi:hypothetical protein